MKNIFLGTSVRNIRFLWPFLRMLLKRRLKSPPMEEIPPRDDTTLPTDPLEVEPLISLHALTGFSAPQTLKLIGYIKHRKSSSLLTVATPIILFTTTLPRKSIVIFMSSTIFKS
jgi:hypothetical protein